jgi:predicted nucleotidyltransferase
MRISGSTGGRSFIRGQNSWMVFCPAENGMADFYRAFHLLYNQSMTRRTVITRIRKHRDHLTKLGVKSLSLFGSVARGEERPDSDVDILVEFKGRATFDRYMDTKFYLEDLLGCKVDLVTPKAIKPRMKPFIMQDLVHVA